MQLDIDRIIVRKRIRKNLGDLTSLMESLSRHGLLNPIVVNRRNELIAGHRRLESARRLGWKTIEVTMLDGKDETVQMEMEIEENTQRKGLSTDELAEAYLRLDRLKNPGFLRRVWMAIKRFVQRVVSRLFRRNAR